MLTCKFCEQSITIDYEHISQKSGKKIPLDPNSKEPHHCEKSFNAWCKDHPLICRYCHETKIYFDDNVRSDNGKRIPLEQDSGEAHNCPNSPYARKRRYGK